jgi:hypothetical protein
MLVRQQYIYHQGGYDCWYGKFGLTNMATTRLPKDICYNIGIGITGEAKNKGKKQRGEDW